MSGLEGVGLEGMGLEGMGLEGMGLEGVGPEGVGLAAEAVQARYEELRTDYPGVPPTLRPFQVSLQSSTCDDNCIQGVS